MALKFPFEILQVQQIFGETRRSDDIQMMVWWDYLPKTQHIPLKMDGWNMICSVWKWLVFFFPRWRVNFQGGSDSEMGGIFFGDIVGCPSLIEISWVWYQCPVLQEMPQNVDSLILWHYFVVIPVILGPDWHPKVLRSWFSAFWLRPFGHVCSVFLRLPPFKEHLPD